MGIVKDRKRGFTMLEMVVTMAIVSIFSGLVYAGYGYFQEEILLKKSHAQIIGTVKKYREQAFYENKTFSISIDCSRGIMTISDDMGMKKIEEIVLPDKLRYRTSLTANPQYVDAKLTFNGNMSKAFTLYIFGRDDVAKTRIAFYTFSQLKYLTVNLYKNISAKNANFENINNYHETTASQNLIGWERQ